MGVVAPESPWRPHLGGRLETAIHVCLLCTAPLIVFWPSVVHQQLPWSADGLYFLAPWAEARPADLSTPRVDEPAFLARHYPWLQYIATHRAEPLQLLWYSNEGGGIPFYTLWRTRCLSPFSIPFYLLPFHTALIVSVIAKFMVAGLCAYVAARAMDIHRPFALFVAVFDCRACDSLKIFFHFFSQ